MQISPEITCFVFCKNEVSGEIENQLADILKIELRRIDILDHTIANRLLMTKNGCVVISSDNVVETAADLTNFFLRHHVWLPVVSLLPASQSIRCHAGVFATASEPNELSQRVVEALRCDLSGSYPAAELRRNMQRLTPREKETMDLFLLGNNTKAVAKALGITYQTVDKHRGRALRKFGAATVVDLQIAIQRTMLESMGIPMTPVRKCEVATQTHIPTPHFPVANSSYTNPK